MTHPIHVSDAMYRRLRLIAFTWSLTIAEVLELVVSGAMDRSRN